MGELTADVRRQDAPVEPSCRVVRYERFERYRAALRRYVARLLDRRLAARVDASDIVQETLLQVSSQHQRTDSLAPVDRRRLLRCIARRRMVDATRRHLTACRRSVAR